MIAIKDFKMPSCCYDCDFSIGVMSTEVDRECTITEKYVNDDDSPDWCPLVDVGNCSEFPNSSDGEYDPKPDIYYLAEKIGIHRLYALVVQLRGEPESCIDTIGRQAAIDAMRVAYWDDNIQSAKDDPCIVDAMTDWAIRQVKALPSAQPEIIRCKECVYADENYHCDYMTTWNDGDCFCCYGKRRTDGRFDKQTGGD